MSIQEGGVESCADATRAAPIRQTTTSEQTRTTFHTMTTPIRSDSHGNTGRGAVDERARSDAKRKPVRWRLGRGRERDSRVRIGRSDQRGLSGSADGDRDRYDRAVASAVGGDGGGHYIRGAMPGRLFD